MTKLTFDLVIQNLYDGNIRIPLSDYLRKSWVRYCYHFSDVENIASALNIGALYSRQRAQDLQLMANDNASADVISRTDDWVKDYVRFYFRPKTPTQFRNEGFRSVETMSDYNAHCPFPVFLLFDFKSILNLNDCQFTDGSLAKHVDHNLYSTPEEFSKLPFEKIYHEGFFTPENSEEIKFRRHAEIIVPDVVYIDNYIQKIMVRSIAEKRTLMSLLDDNAFAKYKHLIQIDSKKNIFFGRWSHIRDVTLSSNRVLIKFNSGEVLASFNLEVNLENLSDGHIRHYSNENYICDKNLNLDLIGEPVEHYSIEIRLNGSIAFHDIFNAEDDWDLPF